MTYAYAVTVNSKKRFGGTVHADSMDDAAQKAAAICKLTIQRSTPVTRPMDGQVIRPADWMLDGKRAFLYVYAPPESF